MNNNQETRFHLIMIACFFILATVVICNYRPSCAVRYKAISLLKKDLLFLDKNSKEYKGAIERIKELNTNDCNK